jgi:hypothetical protein
LQAHQSFFAVYPMRAGTICNDVGDVLHKQQCYGSSSMTSKWHHSKSQQLQHGKQAYYATNTPPPLAKRLNLDRIRRLYWQLTSPALIIYILSFLEKNHKPKTSLKTK